VISQTVSPAPGPSLVRGCDVAGVGSYKDCALVGGRVESPDGAVDDERVTAPSAPARASTHRRFRLVVVVASVVAAIVGTVLLANHRSSEKAQPPVSRALPAGGTVVARIRIGRSNEVLGHEGGGPMAVGEGAVWAMSNDKATLMRIDPARNAIVARIKVDPPDTLAAGDGAVWLSNPSYNTVTRIDPATNAVTATIRVGPQPEGIAVSPGAVWVANAGGLADAGGPSVSRIDPATSRVVKTIPIGPKSACCAQHTNLIASARAVWVALANGNRIVHIDPATNRVVATARVEYPPCGFLAADGTGVWFTDPCSGGTPSAVKAPPDAVARVDSHTIRLTARLAEPSPAGIELAFGSVWVATGSGNIDQIGPHSRRLVARLHVGGEPERLGVGFGSVWVNDDFGRVLRIKPQR
jgi:YVTN family beta-propeller protein